MTTAVETPSGKHAGTENFPVGSWLLPARLRPHVATYYAFARAIGAPGAYDYGPQRVSWLGHLLSNWIGDDGWVQTLSVQVRRFNIVGDLTRCKGVVTGKRHVADQYLVDCDVWAENQRGETTATGTATVLLPSRNGVAAVPGTGDRV